MSEKKPGRPRKASARVERTYEKPDILRVHGKDPKKHYRFVNPENVERRKDEGYVVSQDPNLSTDRVAEDDSKLDSTITRRGQVLMETSKENAQSRMSYFERQGAERLEAVHNENRERARRLGIPFDEKLERR